MADGPLVRTAIDRWGSGCRCSLSTPSGPRSAQAVLDAEEVGVDVVFTWDHFYPLNGEPEGKHFECYTMLAALAADDRAGRDRRAGDLQLVPESRAAGRHGPHDRPHQRWAASSSASGRAGWRRTTTIRLRVRHHGCGSTRSRRAAADRGSAGRLDPPPTRDIPILIGGGGEQKTLRLVARHADIWHGFGDPSTVEHKHDVIDRWCAEEGRDPAEIERSTTVAGRPGETAEALLALGTRLFVLRASGPVL